ncbi:MAG: hypothetical protein PHD01_11560 [Geobacteraceae bacterium]|nr:hypothetical protein [Geobacteraceae bacterium]
MTDYIKNKTERPMFRPKCFRVLDEVLGKSDATVEWIEVAVRHLKREYEKDGSSRINSLAGDYNVRVNPVEFDKICVRWGQLQVLSSYQYLDEFLSCFRKEHPRKESRKREDREDLLTFVMDAYNVSKNDVGLIEFEILDYYRLVRNQLMHNPSGEQGKVHKSQAERILNNKKDNYSTLSAPNHIDAIQFDDFILLTRVIKHFSRVLCSRTTPTEPEWASLILKNSELVKKLRTFIGNDARIKLKLKSYLLTNYCCEIGDEVLTNIFNLCLLAQWQSAPLQEPT